MIGEVQKAEMIENERIASAVLGLDKRDILQNIFLFNITADPYERYDLSQVSKPLNLQLIFFEQGKPSAIQNKAWVI